MDSIGEYFQYVSLSIYGCFMDCVGFMGLVSLVGWAVWDEMAVFTCFGGWEGWAPSQLGGQCLPYHESCLPHKLTITCIFCQWNLPPHTHTYTPPHKSKEENENSLVLTITTTKHIWKNVGSCQDVFKNTIFQVSCVNILSENVGALFLYFTNNWQV